LPARTSSSRGTASCSSTSLLSTKPVDETTTQSTRRPETGTNSTVLSTVSPSAGMSTTPTWWVSSESSCEAEAMRSPASPEPSLSWLSM
jgi:hypothetical protein